MVVLGALVLLLVVLEVEVEVEVGDKNLPTVSVRKRS